MDSRGHDRALTAGERARLAAAAVCVLAALALSLVPHDWVERLLPFEPDAGSGALELLVVVGLGLVAMCLALSVVSVRLTLSDRLRRLRSL